MSMQPPSRIHRKSRRRRGGGGDELLGQAAPVQTRRHEKKQESQKPSAQQTLLMLQRMVGNKEAQSLLKGSVPYAEATEEERNQRLKAYVLAHHEQESWFEGIHGGMSEEDAVKTLTKNFFERQDFEFTFMKNNPFQGKGDCETLIKEFILVALKALGIKLEQKDMDGFIFIEGGGRIIDKNKKTGNVDHGAHWVFEAHHWVVWQGKPVDVIFGMFGEQKKAVPGKMVMDQTTLQLNFADTTVYVASERGPDNLYTLEAPKAQRVSSHPD